MPSSIGCQPALRHKHWPPFGSPAISVAVDKRQYRLGWRKPGHGSAWPRAALQEVAHDQHGDQQGQGDQRDQRVARDLPVDDGDVVAGEVADAGPGSHPQDGAERGQGHEPGEPHLGGACYDPGRLAQPLDEPRDHDDHAAAVVEESLRLVQPLTGQQDVPAEALHQRPATDAATASTPTATMLSRPAPAYRDPAISTVSPGTGRPRFSSTSRPATARYPYWSSRGATDASTPGSTGCAAIIPPVLVAGPRSALGYRPPQQPDADS